MRTFTSEVAVEVEPDLRQREEDQEQLDDQRRAPEERRVEARRRRTRPGCCDSRPSAPSSARIVARMIAKSASRIVYSRPFAMYQKFSRMKPDVEIGQDQEDAEDEEDRDPDRRHLEAERDPARSRARAPPSCPPPASRAAAAPPPTTAKRDRDVALSLVGEAADGDQVRRRTEWSRRAPPTTSSGARRRARPPRPRQTTPTSPNIAMSAGGMFSVVEKTRIGRKSSDERPLEHDHPRGEQQVLRLRDLELTARRGARSFLTPRRRDRALPWAVPHPRSATAQTVPDDRPVHAAVPLLRQGWRACRRRACPRRSG